MRIPKLFHIIFFILSVVVAQDSKLNKIPWPVEVKQEEGTYRLKNTITVSTVSTAIGWETLFPHSDPLQGNGSANLLRRFQKPKYNAG